MTAKIIILGSSNAIPSVDRENTHLLLTTSNRTVLVDCGINPFIRLELAGVKLESITDVILTHFHPDHVSGFPSLMMNMWLLGRREPINVHGLDYTLRRAMKMMDLFGWQAWPDFFKIIYKRVPVKEQVTLLEDEQIRISTSPVIHFLPNICLRFELKDGGKSAVYSCDTEPCQAVIDMARGVDVLIHEASGPYPGHTSAAQAGEIARQAGAGALYLIHYPGGKYTGAHADLVAEAKKHYAGEVRLAVDLMEIGLDRPKN